MVKENLCPDEDKDGEQGSHVWDEDDSSLTRFAILFLSFFSSSSEA
jgi:hypothetical protein